MGVAVRALAASPGVVRAIVGRIATGATLRATTTRNAATTARVATGATLTSNATHVAAITARTATGATATSPSSRQATTTANVNVGATSTASSLTARTSSGRASVGASTRGFAYQLWVVLCRVTARQNKTATYATGNPAAMSATATTTETWGTSECQT